ncbi:FimV/HubP family polar landmark protein [Uliginosibacterium sp. 31-16]|uniref:FimV/HubP family polar landmark protein n=1 Tax=Uliginosibacterium sp. 31-16 TaxID=3068315 RepID=UPI00273D0D1C|nr:FimV/HubP family polar landmark protein [Uliginosibacterium sp. 31-16]MDP5239799.1 FimV/HubP family polar landmark protein [Uliginosibacterium sp. 31-16]
MLRTTLVAAMMLAFCGSAGAAGLGRINVLSTLGQPLRAEVELTAATDELDNMVARMASPEAYKRANIEYLGVMSGVKMSIERRGGGAVVKIVSDKPFGEPFVDLLIDLNWAGGRLLREYTFLLDPAEVSGPRPVAAATQPVSRPIESRLESKPVSPSAPATASKPESAPVSAPAERERPQQAAAGDYTVQRGDNLSKIASELNSGEVTQEQMVAALYRANSDAFVGGNINRLRAGRILKVPEAGEVVQIPKSEARRIILKASNFEQYRQTVASAAAEAPAKEASAGQTASGKIAPKVEDKIAPAQQSRDKVKVTAAETGKSGAPAATDAASKARMQALQDDIASREKALKEANSRVSDLEKNVKELQKLIDLKNKGLADAQAAAKAAESRADKAEKDKAGAALSKAEKAKAEKEQLEKDRLEKERLEQERLEQEKAAAAAKAAEAAAAAASSPVETQVPVTEASPVAEQSPVTAPVAEASAVIEPPKPVVAPPPPPVEEEGLFSNIWALLGLGVVAAGVGYVVVKQRRKQAAAGTGNTQMTESSTVSPNSVFGNAGGQTVDTGGTSLLHTDFSQSGMSAIDADEGVDPVAEADVYMAYGRDAQAEEILLDALKNDPSRTAVYVKLLEIYSQRRALKQFENIATDLYTQTGGVGDDWSKAAALGMKLDPNNPLYKSARAGEESAPVIAVPVEAPAAVPEIPVVQEAPAVSFGTNNISQVRSTWTVPGEINQFTSGEGAVPVLVESAPAPVTPVPEALNLDFNLDLDTPSIEDQPTQIESREEDDLLASMEEAVATQPGGDGAPLEFDIGLDDDVASVTTAGVDTPQRVHSAESDFDIGIEADGGHDALSEVDLEKTNFEGSLLDFDFELGDEAEKPALDLSNVNLRTVGSVEPVTAVVRAPVAAEPIQDNIDVNDEVSTKLELAKAYEEMGDMEGARELLEEVISDGADFQKEQAKTMLGRIG